MILAWAYLKSLRDKHIFPAGGRGGGEKGEAKGEKKGKKKQKERRRLKKGQKERMIEGTSVDFCSLCRGFL